MAIHFSQSTIYVQKRRENGSLIIPVQHEKRTVYTATEDNSTAVAHGYASRELAQRALRTFIHSALR